MGLFGKINPEIWDGLKGLLFLAIVGGLFVRSCNSEREKDERIEEAYYNSLNAVNMNGHQNSAIESLESKVDDLESKIDRLEGILIR